MIFHDVEQNTPEWLQLRVGKITSSALPKIMANYGKAFGEPAKQYAIQVALEQITGERQGDSYKNQHMERGHEEEGQAAIEYENVTFSDVSNGGFFEVGDIGASPDGLIEEDGLVEIKSHVPHIHYANTVRGSFNPSYKWQYIGNLKLTGRDWIDTISYCNSFPEGKKVCIYRINKEDCEEDFKKLGIRIELFRELVSKTKSEILNAKYNIG